MQETQIKFKETEQANIRAGIESDKAKNEETFRKARAQLNEQSALVMSQRRHLNQLQAQNEATQADMTHVSKDLAANCALKQEKLIEVNELECEMAKDTSLHSRLRNQMIHDAPKIMQANKVVLEPWESHDDPSAIERRANAVDQTHSDYIRSKHYLFQYERQRPTFD